MKVLHRFTGASVLLAVLTITTLTSCSPSAPDEPTATQPEALASEVVSYSYDKNGNVDTINTSLNNSLYAYDTLDRLVSDNISTQPEKTLDYDRNGNRSSENQSGVPTNYDYLPNSNQLNTIDGNSITHDAVGNRTSDPMGTSGGNRTFEYNNAGRLHKVYESSILISTYTYNYQGQRTRKVTATGTTLYHYDLSGNVISETTEAGVAKRDYVLSNSVPVAQIESGVETGTTEEVIYFHTDHLSAPRRATNEAGYLVWRWDGEAFGNTAANEDPDGDGVATIINLRFPGQYYDEESGLHYNYFRYYDPSTGRYITSDPIGLDGGLNTYNYVLNNPIKYTDPTGENPVAGAGISAGIDIFIQLTMNGGRFECIKWDVVAIAAFAGALNPFNSISAINTIGRAQQMASRAERMARRAERRGRGARDARRAGYRADRRHSSG
ncbi:MAG: RHS domain-containing protein, partial [Gammaproteobacteria bacterium]|nr:RHS domain-containing protein [Gammaproteobacteria bacterium]